MGNMGLGFRHVFDFCGLRSAPTGYDQVFTVSNAQKPVRSEFTDVSGIKPAVFE